MSTLGVRLPDELQKTLDGICALSKRSKSSIVKEILEEHLEDVYDYHLALSRIQKRKKFPEKPYSLEEVEKELGLNEQN
ncbi:MAG: ribbon-helix-helix protein, CopG family [Simkaniaceae bacterium]|nr:ribbon-helix-helix protein, CopG family [Simkaniaceae bacterium]